MENMQAGQMAHPNDTSKANEHQALLDLVPTETATHTAIASGSWFDPNTWKDGVVPTAGAIVHIPENISVTYEGYSDAPIFALRVDGNLTFTAENGTDTKIVVDTLYTTTKSHFEIDADATTDGTVDIEIRPFDIEAHKAMGALGWNMAAMQHYSDGATVTDTGAGTRRTRDYETVEDGAGVLGRYNWDPKQLSLGIVTHGAVRINGREKLAKTTASEVAMTGDISIELGDVPSGWQVGDRIVIVGTHYVEREANTGESLGSQDEIRTITQIDGNKITFDRALDFNHDTPREGLDAYVTNLTRNIKVHSSTDISIEGVLEADDVGDVATTLGHVMFMHNEDVQVRYAAFDDLGRTNKNDVLDDFQRQGFDGLDAERKTENGEWVTTPVNQITNIRGRYAVHLHRAGATATDSTALIQGSVITGGPGWGFVSHDSSADFYDNITYGVLGTGFMAETGNETGTWARNIAINTYGADYNDRIFTPSGDKYLFENNSTDLTTILEKRGSWKNHDMGHFGDGFWFQGKLINVVDNVSANSGLDGYFYMFRAPDQINVDPNVLVEPLSVHSPDGIHPFAPGLNVFVGNESIADTRGLEMIGIGGGRTNDERSVINNFTAWEVGDVGTGAQYYPGYTIKNSTFIASTNPKANAADGVLWRQVQVDTVLANLEIIGFDQQYDLRKKWSSGTLSQQGFDDPYTVIKEALANGEPNPLPNGYAHVLIDSGFTAAQASQSQFMGSTFDRNYDLILTSADLEIGRFEIELDDRSLKIDLDNKNITYGTAPDDPVRPTLQEGHVLLLKGTKTDSIGTIPIDYLNNSLVWHEDAVQHRLETFGYHQMANGSIGVILAELFSDRYTAEKHIVQFVAELDPRWEIMDGINLGVFNSADYPNVYIPEFLLNPEGISLFAPATSTDGIYRIAVGGGEFTDLNGKVWAADYGFSGGTAYYKAQEIANTDNDKIHYGKRAGNNFSYDIELSNGTYDVALHFMEPRSDAQIGSRVFDVYAENNLMLDNYDIMVALGAEAAPLTAITTTLSNIKVVDGILDLDFSNVAGLPVTLSGIEISPVTPDDTPTNLPTVGEQIAKLTASDAAANDMFGMAVAIDGETMVIGALLDDDNVTNSGSAYIFTKDTDGNWIETAKLTASDAANNDQFGRSISIDNDTMVIGARYDDDNGSNSGSAYIFTRQANGNWTQSAKLTAADGARGDEFGSVSISGNNVVIGAFGDDDKGSNSGAAYIFTQQANGSWTQSAKLTADDGESGDELGRRSIAINGNTAIVGARGDDDNGSNSGAAYIFTQQANGSWTQTAKLKAADAESNDLFGMSVSIDGDTAVVGSRYDDDKGSNSGSAYIFTRQANGNWTQTAKLTADDGESGDEFGYSVSIKDDTLIIGAWQDKDGASNNGSAYIFTRQANGNWTQTAKLKAADGADGDKFGYSATTDGNNVVVGAFEDDGIGSNSGSAYVFSLGHNPSDNLTPVVVADTITVDENSTNNAIDVLANDTSFGDGLMSLSADPTSINGGTISIDDRGTTDATDDLLVYTPATDFSGTDLFSYSIIDTNGDVATTDVTVTINPDTSENSPLRIDVGGRGFTDINGNVWQADYGFQGGLDHYRTQEIAGTDNDEIFYGKRYGRNISYDIAMENGNYDVVIHMMEPQSDAAVGRRVFDVYAEQELAMDNYDIWADMGTNAAPITAVSVTLPNITVTDGSLDLDFASEIDSYRPVNFAGIEIYSSI
ncbi:malectin domain-containing carbohydrate-binding protein [Myxosarcina sp. GI1]|uniref:malectin domain-containing carbohydrate-binding protein n=1 Tax=Myxosarcina sp. GI1 TaxID=1541065 RepID=UPI00068FFAEF|nr:malectin domain-containing carbohydrate-binding protein [Myxosarcina sp. GI1]